jgi:hypothetical protein
MESYYSSQETHADVITQQSIRRFNIAEDTYARWYGSQGKYPICAFRDIYSPTDFIDPEYFSSILKYYSTMPIEKHKITR